MNPPSTPAESSSYSPSTPRAVPHQTQQHISSAPIPQGNMAPQSMPLRSYSQRLANNGPPSARMSAGGPMSYQTTSPPPSATSRVRPHEEYAQMPSHYHHASSRGEFGQTPLSPDAKRRRFNGSGVYIPPRTNTDVAVHAGPTSAHGGPDTPHPYYNNVRRPSAGRPMEHQPPLQGIMGPPNRGYRAQTLQGPGVPTQDPSLTLPPLQTGQGGARPGPPPREGSAQSGPAGIEAVIMSVQPINKIKILAKVAPPLPLTPGSQRSSNRGAIVAVEGVDGTRVRQMTDYLANFLGKDDNGFDVKRYEGGDLDGLKAGSRTEANVKYLEMVRELHGKSKDMADFVTRSSVEEQTKAHGGTQQANESLTSPNTIVLKARETSAAGGDISMEDTTPTGAKTPMAMDENARWSSVSPKTDATPLTRTSVGSKESPSSSPIPVALIPRYQLSAVDTAAMSIPINDSYAPLDHWQWSAALMRGCVGPDITIVIRDDDGFNPAAANNAPQPHTNTGTNVEIRLMDARCVIVTEGGRRAGQGNESNARDAGIDEKALRRVGFEVDEFLRK